MKTASITKQLVIMVSLLMLTTGLSAAEIDRRDLTAGGGNNKGATKVGEVIVDQNGDILTVTYSITNPAGGSWKITETHLEVVETLADIPVTKKGSPKIGHFTYSDSHDYVTSFSYDINVAGMGSDLYVAAHAVVASMDAGVVDYSHIEGSLPGQVEFSVSYPYPGAPAYFPVVEVPGETNISGQNYGWCVDEDFGIFENQLHTANVFSSYIDLTGIVAKPENMSLVNWVLNQDFVGTVSSCADSTFTYGDVQKSIWYLIDSGAQTAGLGAWSQCRVDEILLGAESYGVGFEPVCDGNATPLMGIVLQPVNEYNEVVAQTIVIDVPLSCDYGDETAWGAFEDGNPFTNGRDWSTYFEITLL